MGLFGPNTDKLERQKNLKGLLKVLDKSGVELKLKALAAIQNLVNDDYGKFDKITRKRALIELHLSHLRLERYGFEVVKATYDITKNISKPWVELDKEGYVEALIAEFHWLAKQIGQIINLQPFGADSMVIHKRNHLETTMESLLSLVGLDAPKLIKDNAKGEDGEWFISNEVANIVKRLNEKAKYNKK
ncbi:MAG: hypothetical protein MRJ65_09890 [Candidatus Brocadiaceae bacterium]|nr:hypothetical protein [Candidatus Brocadiaceae bacterium]